MRLVDLLKPRVGDTDDALCKFIGISHGVLDRARQGQLTLAAARRIMAAWRRGKHL